jgi:hypothetical protein
MGRGVHAKVAKALLVALDETEERAQIRGERLESLDDYADDDGGDDAGGDDAGDDDE